MMFSMKGLLAALTHIALHSNHERNSLRMENVAREMGTSIEFLQTSLKDLEVRWADVLTYWRVTTIMDHVLALGNKKFVVARLNHELGYLDPDGTANFCKSKWGSTAGTLFGSTERRNGSLKFCLRSENFESKFLRQLFRLRQASWSLSLGIGWLSVAHDDDGIDALPKESLLTATEFAKAADTLGKKYIELSKIGARLDFNVTEVGLVSSGRIANIFAIHEQNVCDTVACHGGWGCVIFNSSNEYQTGARLIALYLGFPSDILYTIWAAKEQTIWDNSYGREMFRTHGYLAFGRQSPQTIDLEVIGSHYVRMAERALQNPQAFFHEGMGLAMHIYRETLLDVRPEIKGFV